MGEPFDPYYAWLGISKADQPPNYYRLLAIDLFEPSADVISNAADRQMAHLRTYQAGKHSAESQKLLNEVAAARVTLLSPQKKAAYDEALRQRLAAAGALGEESESSGDVRLKAELAEIAKASRHLPARQRPSGTSPWAWAVAAAITAPVAFGILWFASRRPAEVAKQPREKAEVVKTAPMPATPTMKPETLVVQKAEVPPLPPTPVQKTQDKVPLKNDRSPAVPAPASGPAPAPSPPPVAPAAAEPSMSKRPALPPRASATSPPRETARPAGPATAVKQKLPVPDDAAVEQARKAAQALFKAEIEKAKASGDKVALAKRLLAQAADQTGAADRYVLMVMARELAVAAREANTTFQAVDHAAETFEVDRFPLKTEILSGWAKDARTPEARKWAVEQMLTVGEEAIDAGELDAAKELIKLAAGKATGIREVAPKMKAYRQCLADAGKDADELKQAQEALAKDPKDPKANLVAGRYLCFSKGDWKKGLPLLGLGSDQTLKGLAEQELRLPPTEVDRQISLADGWWEVASSLGRRQASAVKRHAGQWYMQGAGSLPEGLVKNKVEQRLREAAKLRTGMPQPPLAIAPFDEKQAKRHHQRWAEYLGTPVEITNSIGMKLVLISPGEFEMGSTPQEIQWALELGKTTHPADTGYSERVLTEGPKHRVKITKPFCLGMYPVTQAEYEKVMGVNPSRFTEKQMDASAYQPPLWDDAKESRAIDAKLVAGKDTSRHPVELVTWDNAIEFCRRLSALPAERAAGRIYRLPTEAEWEYACRAGTTTTYRSSGRMLVLSAEEGLA